MFKLRQGGTSNFVSKIDSNLVEFVSGWEAECLEYATKEEADKAVELVEEIEGIHCEVEPIQGEQDGQET